SKRSSIALALGSGQLGALTELLCKFSYISGACKDNGSAPGIALFAVSTLLILIFTEIVPLE
ncbi:hypothetical protein, partial [Klebsiella aerogenes]|uniref:hypothetical protein n=1 Tax=Klebsiella aerogenes TaxID=548 RepID=UPI001953B97F